MNRQQDTVRYVGEVHELGYRPERREPTPGGGRFIMDVGEPGGTYIVGRGGNVDPYVLEASRGTTDLFIFGMWVRRHPIAIQLVNATAVPEEKELSSALTFLGEFGIPRFGEL